MPLDRMPKLRRVMANMGRRGDDEIAHVTQGEIVVPRSWQTQDVMQALQDEARRTGTSVSRYRVRDTDGNMRARFNPETGAQEFFDGTSGPGGEGGYGTDAGIGGGFGGGGDHGGDGGGPGNGGYGANMGRAGSTPGQAPDRGPVGGFDGTAGPGNTGGYGTDAGIGGGFASTPHGGTGPMGAVGNNQRSSVMNAAGEHGLVAEVGPFDVTHQDLVDVAAGAAIPGPVTPETMRSAARTAGNAITSAVTSATGAEAAAPEGHVGPVDTATPDFAQTPDNAGDGGGNRYIEGSESEGNRPHQPDTADDAGSDDDENGLGLEMDFMKMDPYERADVERGVSGSLPVPGRGRRKKSKLSSINPATGLQEFAGPWGDVSSDTVESLVRSETGYSGPSGDGELVNVWQQAKPSARQSVKSAIDARNESSGDNDTGGGSGGGSGGSGSGGGETAETMEQELGYNSDLNQDLVAQFPDVYGGVDFGDDDNPAVQAYQGASDAKQSEIDAYIGEAYPDYPGNDGGDSGSEESTQAPDWYTEPPSWMQDFMDTGGQQQQEQPDWYTARPDWLDEFEQALSGSGGGSRGLSRVSYNTPVNLLTPNRTRRYRGRRGTLSSNFVV